MQEKKLLRLPVQPQFGRRDLFHSGLIEAYRCPPLTCFVRDLTLEGARILVKADVPTQFKLTLPTKGLRVNCEIADKGEGYVDVRFL